MVIFHSYVGLPEGTERLLWNHPQDCCFPLFSQISVIGISVMTQCRLVFYGIFMNLGGDADQRDTTLWCHQTCLEHPFRHQGFSSHV